MDRRTARCGRSKQERAGRSHHQLKLGLRECATTRLKADWPAIPNSLLNRIEGRHNDHRRVPRPCQTSQQKQKHPPKRAFLDSKSGGAGGIRTPYLLTASQTLSQLSYSPEFPFEA